MNNLVKQTQASRSVNKNEVDGFIRRYQISTKNAVESILNMGEAVFEVYTRAKSKELSEGDLKYFCDSVNLGPKSSSFRKYKAIGQNANRFREHMERLPSTFSVLYEMATLSGDDFERFMSKGNLSKNITLEQFKKMVAKSTVLTRNKMFNPPILKYSHKSVAQVIKESNKFTVSLVRNVPESKFDEFVDILTKYRNDGWLQFDEPIITACLTKLGEEEFYEKLQHAQLSGDYLELAQI